MISKVIQGHQKGAIWWSINELLMTIYDNNVFLLFESLQRSSEVGSYMTLLEQNYLEQFVGLYKMAA